MRVNVTEADIKAGKRECCTGCPIALAILRGLQSGEPGYVPIEPGARALTGATDYAEVNASSDISVNGMHHVVSSIDDKYNVDKFICDFDEGLFVEPISFELVPYEWEDD